LSGLTLVNTSNVVFEDHDHAGMVKIFEAKDSESGGGAQVPRIWERETTDPKPTEADYDQSR
jgi:hypothetical protein